MKQITLYLIIIGLVQCSIAVSMFEQGSYEISMKDQNIYDESDWSESFFVAPSKKYTNTIYEYDNYCFTMDIPFIAKNIHNKIPLLSSSIVDLPLYFSWKDHNDQDWTTPAKNQGNCGSCWIFAAIGTLESIIKIRENNSEINPDLSEQYILSCLPAAANEYGKGCQGGRPYDAFFYLMDDGEEGNNFNGAIPESCMPYMADDTIPCSIKCDDWMNQLVPISDIGEQWFEFDNETNRNILKNIIYTHGPVSSGINVNDDFIRWGNYHHSEDDYYMDPHMPWGGWLNHIIVIIGWKDNPLIPNGGYWICKNEWGTDWGYDGFFNIEYGGLSTGSYIAWVDYTVDNLRPEKPQTPIGPSLGTIDEIYTYLTKTTDPDGEDLYYYFDWGDGTDSGWIGPIESGKNCTGTVQWITKGKYHIRVKAKDIHGYESEWSDSISVSIPRCRTTFEINIISFFDLIISRFPFLNILLMILDL